MVPLFIFVNVLEEPSPKLKLPPIMVLLEVWLFWVVPSKLMFALFESACTLNRPILIEDDISITFLASFYFEGRVVIVHVPRISPTREYYVTNRKAAFYFAAFFCANERFVLEKISFLLVY